MLSYILFLFYVGKNIHCTGIVSSNASSWFVIGFWPRGRHGGTIYGWRSLPANEYGSHIWLYWYKTAYTNWHFMNNNSMVISSCPVMALGILVIIGYDNDFNPHNTFFVWENGFANIVCKLAAITWLISKTKSSNLVDMGFTKNWCDVYSTRNDITYIIKLFLVYSENLL